MYILSKPMTTHTFPRPFCLANPTPIICTSSSSACHVHTPSIPFCWCSTLGTRFCKNFDGDFRSLIPSGRSRSCRIHVVRTICGVTFLIRIVGLAVSDVITLQAQPAENVLKNEAV